MNTEQMSTKQTSMNKIWSGSISFGLIRVPVELYSATKKRRINLDLLRKKDKCPVGYSYICKDTGEVVEYEDIVRGYKLENGEYIVLEEEDFQKASIRKTHTLDVLHFADADTVPLKHITRPYLITPGDNADQVYALIREALRRTNKVGIVQFVLRTKQNLGMIKVENNKLFLYQLRYLSELKEATDIELPAETDVRPQQLELAVQLVHRLSKPFSPDEYRDTYMEELQSIIEKKVAGKEIEPQEEIPLEATPINQLFSKLQQSLAETETPPTT